MILDAVVLAGGRAARLGGIDKTALEVDGRSLVTRAVDAVGIARRVVVVGRAPSDPRYRVVREDPPFGGPAAALAAGIAALDADPQAPADGVLLLAGDMPSAGPAVDALVRSAATESGSPVDGHLAVDADGRRQYLTALLLLPPLRVALGDRDLVNASMRETLARLRLLDVPVPTGSTRDVDTPADLADLGIRDPTQSGKASPVTTPSELPEWNARLSAALDVPAAPVDEILDLAGSAAHRIVRPAAPVTTFLVGYAAAELVARGASPGDAVRRATEVAERLLASDGTEDA